MSIFNNDLFLGKVALITGGATGIGRGIAEALARHGADVAIVSRRQENLTTAAEQIVACTGRRCLPLVADVRHPEAVVSAVNRAVEELGKLDIVVNNAAGNFICASADLSPNGFGTVIDIDAKGTWNVSRAAYQATLKERGGQILNISATLHYGGTPGQVHVAAAKAAVDALTRTLAVEWGPRGIRVNAIAPGPIGDTEGASAGCFRVRSAGRRDPGRDPNRSDRLDRRHRQPGSFHPERGREPSQRRHHRVRWRPLPHEPFRPRIRDTAGQLNTGTPRTKEQTPTRGSLRRPSITHASAGTVRSMKRAALQSRVGTMQSHEVATKLRTSVRYCRRPVHSWIRCKACGSLQGGMPMPLHLGPGPVFVHESIAATRRWQIYALRSFFVLGLLAALALVWLLVCVEEGHPVGSISIQNSLPL